MSAELVGVGAVKTGASRRPLEVVHDCLAAHRSQDWERLRTLFHPEARIGTFAGGGAPDDPEKAIADMRRAHEDRMYGASVLRASELDERAALLEGRVRYRSDAGFADVERCWLYVVLDGLLYRSQVFESAYEARATYQARGPTLGA